MTPNLRLGGMRFANFGTFRGQHEFDWDRGPGLWYISGKNLKEPELGANGAGKTTLLTALFWALYGRTLRNSRPGERVEPWNGSGTTFVEQTFYAAGREHVVYRSRKPNKLLLNGVVVTDAEIQKLLPAPEVVLYSFILGQTNTLFLDLKPEPQSQLFTDLLELDLWLRAAERAGEAGRKAEKSVEAVNASIASVQGQLDELAKHVEETKELENRFEAEGIEKIEQTDALIGQIRRKKEALVEPDAPAPVTGLAEAEKRVSEAAAGMRAWSRKAGEIAGNMRSLQRGIDKLKNEAKTAVAGDCPTCGQPLGIKDHKKIQEHLDAELAKLREELASLIAKGKEAQEQEAEWGDEFKEAETALNALREKDQKHRAERREYDRQVAAIISELDRLKNERQALYDSPNPYTAQLAKLAKRHSDLTADLQDFRAEHYEFQNAVDTAKLWQDGFRSIRLSIIEDTLSEVSMAANRHAERLGLVGWHAEFATERETKKGTTSLGFTTFLYPPDIETPIAWDSYSGGESTRWQLAVSFGLAEVLLARAGIVPNVEIYDEPTKGLSSEGISDLLDCLAERARETERTIYIIDHHVLSQGSFDGVVTVEKTGDGSRLL